MDYFYFVTIIKKSSNALINILTSLITNTTNFNFIRERGGLGLHCLKYILGMEAFRLINKYYELEVPKPTSPDGRVKRKVKHSKRRDS